MLLGECLPGGYSRLKCQTWTLQDSILARVPLPAHSSQCDPRVSLFPNLPHTVTALPRGLLDP